ncbi:hypothetical protein L596_029696 [Steinernema carpocapsae]|uniref:Uncharacterized protein n=1 Tax=Steinernema carpocapsae TaxID=34508 RepID=A0A4U5LQH4_STECR|nr:hypothetical protein L596_029696 [Steinernema carpocapsae]
MCYSLLRMRTNSHPFKNFEVKDNPRRTRDAPNAVKYFPRPVSRECDFVVEDYNIQQQVTTAEENSKGSNEPPAKRRKQKKRTTMIGQLQALPPTQVVIKAEHVAEALAASDVTTFNKLFEVAVRARQVDVVLEVILKMCADSDKNVPLSFDALSKFGQHLQKDKRCPECGKVFLSAMRTGRRKNPLSPL